MRRRSTRQSGFLFCLLTQAGGGGGSGFTIPTPPTSSTATKIPLNPNWTSGPTGLDPYRPLRPLVVDGELFVTNGWDAPRRWDRANNAWALMGSASPTDFTLTLSSAGTPAAIPTGRIARYYVVGYDSTLDKETAPQLAAGGDPYFLTGTIGISVSNTSGSTRDVTVAWTPGSLPTQYDKRRIYRALDGTDDYHRVAEVADATGTYLDVDPDATLRTNGSASWDGTLRTTLPPNWVDFQEANGIVYAWLENTDALYYSRGVRVTGTYIADDFLDASILPIGADEGTGAPRAMEPYQGTKIVWKESSTYEFTGDDPFTFQVSRISGSRGTFNRKTVVAVGRRFVCFDRRGAYRLTPGLGTDSIEDTDRVAEQPILDRLNISAFKWFHGQHLPISGNVIFWVALDYEPMPNVGLLYDDRTLTFLGLVTRRNPSATGYLRDGTGGEHPCFGDDMAYLWEAENAQSEGVYAGDNTATATAMSGLVLTASAAAFNTTIASGAPGAPCDRYSSAGAVVDENRVYAATGTSLTMYLYPTTAYASGDTVAIGVIPALYVSAMFSFNTHEMKNVREVVLEYASGVSGSIRIDTSLDDDSFTRKFEQSLLTGVSAIVPMAGVTVRQRDECFLWRLRVSQRYANLGFSLRAIHVHYDDEFARRHP